MPSPESLAQFQEFAQNLINIADWNNAGFFACGFSFAALDKSPLLILAFRNEAAAKKIFIDFQARFGKSDHANLLRVSIIEGGIEINRHAYSLCIGPNIFEACDHFGVEFNRGETINFAQMGRTLSMNPQGPSQALLNFKTAFMQGSSYILCPATATNGTLTTFENFGIEKPHLNFRLRSDIMPGDPDEAALDTEGIH